MRLSQVCRVAVLLFASALLLGALCYAQTTNATITGEVTDQSGKLVPGVNVLFTNINTDVPYIGKSNGSGIYTLPNLPPGIYRANVTRDGFKSVVKSDIEIHVQDQISINFNLQVGSVTETITVEAGAPIVDTQSAAVSTVVEQHFVESIPLNGRSLQPLITLTPGVVLTASNSNEQGQFSVNGQRADANYFMVDGVSANFGAGAGNLGQAAAGALPGLNAAGGTNNLVSIDAVQEVRVETSSYAPEFGRTPGGQISIVTRSGTNQFHGDVFDYFRNDALDANDWFSNANGLPKAAERQNDFGGALGGPIKKDRTFFFFSYEGARLLQPATAIRTVPDVAFRQSAPTPLQPLLNGLPIPNGKNFGNGTAQFVATYSNPTTLNATSIRLDHKLNSRITVFGQYDYAPSETAQRAGSLSDVNHAQFPVQTVTVGSNQLITTNTNNDFRFNYSRSDWKNVYTLDTFGGAVPPSDSLLFPSPYSSANGTFTFSITGKGSLEVGNVAGSSQRQINLVDNLVASHGTHQLKFGVDYRRLTPSNNPFAYLQNVIFFGLTGSNGVSSGNVPFLFVGAADHLDLIFQNLSLYAQDTWKLKPRLTLTYGLRWELNPSLRGGSGTPLYTVQDINDPANMILAPPGTPFYKTTYDNFAPRIGLATQVSTKRQFESVVRGGFGIFYDLGVGILGNGSGFWPYSRSNSFIFQSIPYPIPPNDAAPPPFSTSIPTGGISQIEAAVPNFQLPRTYQWNVAIQQSLGSNRSLTVTYVGAVGKDLIRQEALINQNANLTGVYVNTNASSSTYHALQAQYQQRLSHGLQALRFYSWSHCIDDASGDSGAFTSNPSIDRADCDFDIRHSFHGVITYDIPTPRIAGFGRTILGGWAVDAIAVAQSAPPIDLNTSLYMQGATVRPDVVAGIPLYSYGSQYPGGKAINSTPGAVVGGCSDGSQSVGPFCPPPVDSDGNPLRQGNLGRNVLRGFGLAQLDFALRRQVRFSERWTLQFSAEFFNALNHPNFGNVDGCTCNAPGTFGQSQAMLSNALSGGLGQGGFNPLYQVGGPRSIQLALKLGF